MGYGRYRYIRPGAFPTGQAHCSAGGDSNYAFKDSWPLEECVAVFEGPVLRISRSLRYVRARAQVCDVLRMDAARPPDQAEAITMASDEPSS